LYVPLPPCQAEAARDLAQLKLAEQIIQEKERHIQEEEYRVDVALMEKEALVEELAGVRSKKTLESLGRDEAVQSPTSGKVCLYINHLHIHIVYIQ
jgi:hypothetical protein